jgi:hypothetical protein
MKIVFLDKKIVPPSSDKLLFLRGGYCNLQSNMFCEGHFIKGVDFEGSIIGLPFFTNSKPRIFGFVDKIKIIQLIQQRVIN